MMSNDTIYTTLLSAPRSVDGREFPLHGFSYRIYKTDGLVEIRELGGPAHIILYDKDGPELADLTEQMVKDRIEEVLS